MCKDCRYFERPGQASVKRDFVIEVIEASGIRRLPLLSRILRLSVLVSLLLLRLLILLLRLLVALLWLLTTLAAIKHLHVIGHDFGGVPVLTVLTLPFPCLQPALDVDLRAFLDVLLDYFSQLVERHHRMPLGALLALPALLVHPTVTGGYAQVGNW